MDVRAFAGYFLLTLFTAAICWILWRQSMPLYASSGFDEPKLIASGAILMMLGFAAFHSLTRSKLACALCLYACLYEGFFIVSGTLKDEVVLQAAQVAQTPELVWLKEKMERASGAYLEAKARFEDPSSKVFQNAWYKAQHVGPAWEAYSQAHQDLGEKSAALAARVMDQGQDGPLKILYRLGLVFLSMLCVHRLVRIRAGRAS